MIPFILFLLLLFGYSLLSRWIEQSAVTAPIIFTTPGMLMFPPCRRFAAPDSARWCFYGLRKSVRFCRSFTDASRTELRILRSIQNLPARLLSIGMLLTTALGALAAKLVFPAPSTWEAGILAAILAPTDAGLGRVIVNSPRVPMRIRQALSVEAGLNDGLSVPFMLFFIALAAAKIEGGLASLTQFIVEQFGCGVLVGLGLVSRAAGCWAARAETGGWRNRFSKSAWSLCRLSAWGCPNWLARACS